MSVQDPFYLVREEVQDAVNKLQARYSQLERVGGAERLRQAQDVATACDSLEWQVGELDKAVSVAERDPMRFNISSEEIAKRRKWISGARGQITTVKRGLQAYAPPPEPKPSRAELMNSSAASSPNIATRSPGLSGQNNSRPAATLTPVRSRLDEQNDLFVADEAHRQQLMFRQQDEDLEELSMGVQRIGRVGLTIHDELVSQEALLNDFEQDVDATSTRLQLVQKKAEALLKKGGMKFQLGLIVFLLLLFVVLLALTFL
eukprot:jgi/Chlat1/4327/Chrsp29S04487